MALVSNLQRSGTFLNYFPNSDIGYREAWRNVNSLCLDDVSGGFLASLRVRAARKLSNPDRSAGLAKVYV